MAISTFGAIDIGSSEVSLKIFEISKKNGLKELTHVRRSINLGAETYNNKIISYKTIDEICKTLNDFKRVLSEFNTTTWHARTSSAIREAENAIVVIDQITVQTGFNVKILSNSEARFLYYKALAITNPDFDSLIQDGTLIIDIGSGSVQLSVFDNGKLCATQNLLLGASRIQELLHATKDEAYDYEDLIDEYIEKDLVAFAKLYLDSTKIKNIIATGRIISEIYYLLLENKSEFNGTLPQKILTKAKLPKVIPAKQARLVTPSLLILRKLSKYSGCQNISLSNVTLCDSLAADYAEKKFKLIANHNFTEDILNASRMIARKYHVDMEHVANVENLALQIFDKIRKLHGLGKRERLLLQNAIILHNCGSYISLIQSRECSYRIIMSTEIIGLSHKERAMVANIVRYNDVFIPSYELLDNDFSKEDYIKMVKINAIATTANVLDKSNRHKINNVDVSLSEGILTITADTMSDITLEKGLFHQKADIFQEVFGIRPVLKQKRSGK